MCGKASLSTREGSDLGCDARREARADFSVSNNGDTLTRRFGGAYAKSQESEGGKIMKTRDEVLQLLTEAKPDLAV